MNVIQLIEQLPQDETGRRQLRDRLATHNNHLLLHQFEQLVQLLYRIDVSEQKLKKILQHNPGTNAGELIADLLIQRQLEKLASRQSFPPPADIPDDDRW